MCENLSAFGMDPEPDSGHGPGRFGPLEQDRQRGLPGPAAKSPHVSCVQDMLEPARDPWEMLTSWQWTACERAGKNSPGRVLVQSSR